MSVKTFVMLAFLFSLMKEHETSTELSMLLIVVSSFPDYNTTHVKLTVHSTISSINNSSSILSGNDLGYTVLDSMVRLCLFYIHNNTALIMSLIFSVTGNTLNECLDNSCPPVNYRQLLLGVVVPVLQRPLLI